jgi:hypothetical protein
MAETRRPDKAGRGALADGVERFDRLVRKVKNSQLARTKTGARPPATEAFERSPEDAWAKKYMTHCIGPVCFTVEAMAEPPVFAKFTVPPEASVHGSDPWRPGSKTAQDSPPPRVEEAERANPAPIGLVIGKPVRRRSWLVRLIGR